MHARMEFVRAAAGRLADFLRPNDRVIVAPFAQSLGAITGTHRRRETIAGAVRQSRPKEARRSATASRSLTPRRNAEGRHVIVLVTDGYDEDSKAKMEDALVACNRRTPRYTGWHRWRRRHLAEGRTRAQENRPRHRRARFLPVAGRRAAGRPRSSPTTCSSAT